MRSYLLLLSRPRARPMVVAAAVTRLGSPMLTLSLLLAVHAARGSFAAGGVALAAHAVALAAGAPVGGRLADRYQPGPLLLGALALHLAMYGLLITALVHPDVPMPVLVAVAALLGFTTPPASAVTRGVWPALVESDQLHTAYALDTVLNEAAFVVGPLIVTGLVVFLAPATVVAISGGF